MMSLNPQHPCGTTVQEQLSALGKGRPRGAQISLQYILLGRSENLFYPQLQNLGYPDILELSGQSSQIFISASLAAMYVFSSLKLPFVANVLMWSFGAL